MLNEKAWSVALVSHVQQFEAHINQLVLHQYLPICGSYSTNQRLKLQIWRFSWRRRWQTDKTDCFTPCACAWGSNWNSTPQTLPAIWYLNNTKHFDNRRVIVGRVVTFATFLKKCDGEWPQCINSTLVSFIISHRCVCRHNNLFLEGKDIPQEISLPVAVEGGKLLLQQLEVRYYQWLLAIVYNLF